MSIDLQKKKSLNLLLLFIPVAYATCLFHEFGHWIIGELLGNEMAYSLNYVWPKSGSYIDASQGLYVLAGGPAFSILQAMLGLLILEKRSSIFIYPFVFFPMFSRIFSLVFGGFGKQDEARVSALLGVGTFTIAIFVVLILILLAARCSYKLKIGFKWNNIFVVASTIGQLLVIGTYTLIP